MKKRQLVQGKISAQSNADHPLSHVSHHSKRDDPSYFRYPNNYQKENGTGEMEDEGDDLEDEEEDDEEEDNHEEFMDASD
jgi:hypothetical protein